MSILIAPIDVRLGNMKCPDLVTLLTDPVFEGAARAVAGGDVELGYGDPPDNGSAYYGTICATSFTVDISGTIPSSTDDYIISVVVNNATVKSWSHTYVDGEPALIPFSESFTGNLVPNPCGNVIEIEVVEYISSPIGQIGVTASISAS